MQHKTRVWLTEKDEVYFSIMRDKDGVDIKLHNGVVTCEVFFKDQSEARRSLKAVAKAIKDTV